MKHIVYFDSGTTNSRIFLLDENLNVIANNKYQVGSKDVAATGGPEVLVKGLYSMYSNILSDNKLTDSDVADIFISGNATSKDGIKEVPYSLVPVDENTVAKSTYNFEEELCFKRTVHLIRGIKADSPDITHVGNMRGEETEVIGLTSVLEQKGVDNVAVLLPGSHTHIAYVQKGRITDCISNFTGEMFYALKEDTLLKPILSVQDAKVDTDMVNLALKNLETFGFNRAIYLAHTMRVMDQYPMEIIFSYAEAVINGGIKTILDYACSTRWKDCSTVAILGNSHYSQLFRTILSQSNEIKTFVDIPQDNVNYALEGFKKIYKNWKVIN